VVRFARLARDGAVDQAFAAAVLDPAELDWALAAGPSPVRLAAAVALKEAAVKCAGGRWPGFRWRSLRLTPDLGDRAGTADTGVRVDAAGSTGPAGRPGHRAPGRAGAARRQAGSPGAASGSAPVCGCARRAEQILAGLSASAPRRALVHAPALSACPASPAPAAETTAPARAASDHAATTAAGDRAARMAAASERAARTAAGTPAARTAAGDRAARTAAGDQAATVARDRAARTAAGTPAAKTAAGDRAARTAAGTPAAWTVAGEFVVALVIGVPVGRGAGG
jgi:peptide/nickel transport system ATP-binding protein